MLHLHNELNELKLTEQAVLRLRERIEQTCNDLVRTLKHEDVTLDDTNMRALLDIVLTVDTETQGKIKSVQRERPPDVPIQTPVAVVVTSKSSQNRKQQRHDRLNDETRNVIRRLKPSWSHHSLDVILRNYAPKTRRLKHILYSTAMATPLQLRHATNELCEVYQAMNEHLLPLNDRRRQEVLFQTLAELNPTSPIDNSKWLTIQMMIAPLQEEHIQEVVMEAVMPST
jgi:hypothetical protein